MDLALDSGLGLPGVAHVRIVPGPDETATGCIPSVVWAYSARPDLWAPGSVPSVDTPRAYAAGWTWELDLAQRDLAIAVEDGLDQPGRMEALFLQDKATVFQWLQGWTCTGPVVP